MQEIAETDELLAAIETATTVEEIIELAKQAGVDPAELEDDVDQADDPPDDEERWFVATLAEVAEFVGRATDTVRHWRTEKPPMPGKPGRYDVREILRWCIARHERRKPKQSSEKLALEKQKLELEVESKRDKVERESARLVRRDAVDEAVRRAHERIRNRLEQLPDELARSLPARVPTDVAIDVVNDFRHMIDLALRELSPVPLGDTTLQDTGGQGGRSAPRTEAPAR